jgi:sugar O-acyltransferase (sialic acid O-acetyltransferase NeuD family)
MLELVIFGASNILSDVFDCAMANHLPIAHIVTHLPEGNEPRSIPLSERLAALAVHGCHPTVVALDDFVPGPNQLYLLGPTTPERSTLAGELARRFALRYTTLVHPTAYVSPLATLGEGVYIGANSIVAPGARLHEHVFVNRAVTIGHDTEIGAFSRIQPGCNLGGLSRIGSAVTVGIGATLIERLVVGDGAFIGAGAVVIGDVPARVLMVGVPASVKRYLDA